MKQPFRRTFGSACALLAALVYCIEVCDSVPQLSASKSLVFGPGVDPKRSQLPVNYFYVQAVDTDGNNYTEATGDNFQVSIDAEGGVRLRRRYETYNLGGGLFLHYYRVFDDYETLIISITHEHTHIAQSPYTIKNVFTVDCACPLRTAEQWLAEFKCEGSNAQIESDLGPFRKEGGVNITGLYERLGQLFSRWSLIHYSIVDNKLYAQKFGSITGFKFLSDMILLSIVNRVKLPDMELVVNLGDWPVNKKSMELYPVFSWCGSDETRDIVWPTWDMMKSTILGLDRVSLSILSAQQTQGITWEDKIPKALFRGRDSNQARLDLVRLHRNNTEMFDVGITNWFFFPFDVNLYGLKAKRVGFHDFFKYKYQLNIDGTVAAYRFPFLLAGGSLIFKQDSDYYEYFYHELEPWVHYVPMKRDVSDVVEKVEWAMENDEKAQEIAHNAFQYVQDRLLPDHQYCYMISLLKEYADLQVGVAHIHPGMEPVQPEKPHNCTEFCSKLQQTSRASTQKEEL